MSDREDPAFPCGGIEERHGRVAGEVSADLPRIDGEDRAEAPDFCGVRMAVDEHVKPATLQKRLIERVFITMEHPDDQPIRFNACKDAPDLDPLILIAFLREKRFISIIVAPHPYQGGVQAGKCRYRKGGYKVPGMQHKIDLFLVHPIHRPPDEGQVVVGVRHDPDAHENVPLAFSLFVKEHVSCGLWGPTERSYGFLRHTGRMHDALDELILVLCTAPPSVSGGIARALLEERFAACVNRCVVHSMYWWEGDLVSEDEDLLIIKTVEHLFDAVEDKIREMHPYDIPEIIAVPVAVGSDDYLRWVRQTVLIPQ